MSWLDQLQPASLDGVPFQVDTIEVSFGDNTVLREYPFQDLPTVFRMGEGVEDIKFAAYVIGDDYIDQREALREVLTGERVLIHPTAGALRVYVVGKPTMKENPSAEGGMARFELHFVRAEARRYPVGVANTQAQADSAALDASDAAQDQFAADWNLKDVPGWTASAAITNLTDSLDGLWANVKTVQTGLGDYSNQLIGGYQALRSNLGVLINAPRQLAGSIASLFSLPTDLSAALSRDFQSAFGWAFDLDKKRVRNAFQSVVIPAPQSNGRSGAGDAGLVIYGTANAALLSATSTASTAGTQLAQLMAASDQLFETLATAAYVRAVASMELTGYDEALTLRRTINDQCIRLLLEASSAAPPGGLTKSLWHTAVLAMHSKALGDLQVRSRDLVRLSTYTPQAWEPVWLISYKLFGTAAYADEILAMNPHIRHPLLAPPGRALRVARHD